MTKSFDAVDGRVFRVNAAEVRWREEDGRRVFDQVPCTDFSIDIELVILAMGFTGITHGRLIYELGLEPTPSGAIAVAANYMSTVPGVFAAGDAVLGPSLVVKAIWQGREAARCIHEAVMSRQAKM
jgi:glutamate synthase (NADPH/NADH) small chain